MVDLFYREGCYELIIDSSRGPVLGWLGCIGRRLLIVNSGLPHLQDQGPSILACRRRRWDIRKGPVHIYWQYAWLNSRFLSHPLLPPHLANPSLLLVLLLSPPVPPPRLPPPYPAYPPSPIPLPLPSCPLPMSSYSPSALWIIPSYESSWTDQSLASQLAGATQKIREPMRTQVTPALLAAVAGRMMMIGSP